MKLAGIGDHHEGVRWSSYPPIPNVRARVEASDSTRRGGSWTSAGKKDQSKSFKRKLEKKRHFYEKVKDVVVSLGTKKTIIKKKRLRNRQKKLKAYDLSALSQFLPDLDTLRQPIIAPGLKQNYPKCRQKLIKRESAKLRAVLNDPSFQTDPLAAIHQYLERTQPPLAVSQEKRTRKQKNKDKGKLAKGSSSEAEPSDKLHL